MLELVRVIVQPNWDLGLRSIGRIKRRIDITNQGLVLALEDNDTITGHELAVLLLFNSVVVRSLGAGLFCRGVVVGLLCLDFLADEADLAAAMGGAFAAGVVRL